MEGTCDKLVLSSTADSAGEVMFDCCVKLVIITKVVSLSFRPIAWTSFHIAFYIKHNK